MDNKNDNNNDNAEKQDTFEIVIYPDPRLTARNEEIGEITDEIRASVKKMFDTMYAGKGMGLAAPQAGWNTRLFIMNTSGTKEGERVCINPAILDEEGENEREEGCLSFPEIHANVVRPEKIKVEYTDLDGKLCTAEFEGVPARAFCHETDHVNGTLYITRMAPAEKARISGKLKDLKRAFKKKKKQ